MYAFPEGLGKKCGLFFRNVRCKKHFLWQNSFRYQSYISGEEEKGRKGAEKGVERQGENVCT